MSRLPLLRIFGALCLLGASGACALPHGSFARPVQAAGEGSVMIGGGVMVPFAAVGGGTVGGDSDFGSGTAEEAFVVPAGSFDYALGDRHYIGFDVSVWSGTFATADNFDALGVFVNPRWEYGLNENFSLTVDGNLGYVGTTGSESTGAPFLAPTFGIRAYLPTGFGGAVISQQFGTAFITVTLPGSAAYDLPIPLGEETVLHVFPEVRWDPTFLFAGDASGVLAFFSGGLSLMLEI